MCFFHHGADLKTPSASSLVDKKHFNFKSFRTEKKILLYLLLGKSELISGIRKLSIPDVRYLVKTENKQIVNSMQQVFKKVQIILKVIKKKIGNEDVLKNMLKYIDWTGEL